MKFWFLVFISFILLFGCNKVDDGKWGERFWEEDGYFVQKCIDASRIDEGVLRGKVDGNWQEFKLIELPEAFQNWSFKSRLETLAGIPKGEMPSLDGPHNGIIATYGYRREDSRFRVNNAIKGCGFLPKKEKMKEVIQLLKDTYDDDYMDKLQVLTDLYENPSEYFDMTKQISLELYSVPERGTQTFVNQMTDPTSVIVFMDYPTFKLKTLAYLLHPENPDLTEYEKDVVEYTNLIHSYFHGDFDKTFIAVIYNVVEVYNSTPGTKEGKGTKIVP
ncbi:MAG: hypothetical protein K9N09_05695 [Candidatus Cloacimonetes bacterium]|nr:hypothetical protein [Candidatus Cloacimonadota bacterium]MCF7814701.1 hypothetical protein [Candidatus Cloacimonadota bacterium]MCF7868178.1 hypothetical protein [Candidatus Cloacimonadota bacterium]MCF7884470.1 hypothetical protein [Candidatus Cloacimonadota bacterium]